MALSKKPKKIFVLDTNVLLHDSASVHQFKEHDVVIPITVIEELDQFKKGSGSLNFHAREALRTVDSLSAEQLFNGGVRLGPRQGKLSIRLEQELHRTVAVNFSNSSPDHRILNIAYRLAKANPRARSSSSPRTPTCA